MSNISDTVQQKFLLKNIRTLINKRNELYDDSYDNLITVKDINPNDFINNLFKLPNEVYESYVNLTPLNKAMLYPHLSLYRYDTQTRMFKHIMANSKFDSRSIDIYQNDTDPKTIFETMDEISGVGIERVVINNTPERESDINIKVTIDLFIENILWLMHDDIRKLITIPLDKNFSDQHNDPTSPVTTPATTAVAAATAATPFPLTAAMNAFDAGVRAAQKGVENRIKLVYGWNIPEDFTDGQSNLLLLQNALKYSYSTILCELYRHDLRFNDDGSITLRLEYIGGLEGVTKSKKADLFNPENYISENMDKIPVYKENLQKIKELEKQNKFISSDPSNSQKQTLEKNKENIEKLKEDNRKYIRTLITPLYGKVILDLVKDGKIFIVNFEDIDKFTKNLIDLVLSSKPLDNVELYDDVKYTITTKSNNQHPNSAIDKFILNTKYKVESEDKTKKIQFVSRDGFGFTVEKQETKKPISEEDIKTEDGEEKKPPDYSKGADIFNTEDKIYYFHLGDLISIIMKTLKFTEDDLNFIFGTFDYVLEDGKVDYISLADIPINLYSFIVYWNNYVISAKPTTYIFHQFIKDLFKDFVIQFFGDFGNQGNSSRLTTYSVDIDHVSSIKKITPKSYSENEILESLTNDYNLYINKNLNVYKYVIITARSVYNQYLNANYLDDLNRGIYHYRIAQSSGIIQTVSFSKIDNQKLYDARMVNQELNQAGNILKEHYDVKIKCIGNPLFQNGKYFYLDPSYNGLKFGKKITETIGLGGYYFVHGVENIITSDGNWTTNVNAKFHSEPFENSSGKLNFNRINKDNYSKTTNDPSKK